ncbi:MAG: phosphopantothenoylcysteine decarboxylase [Tepidisphaeraceae bacterium]
MRILITAGPTYEPIDPVRFIGNRSSGRMGAALASAASSSGELGRAGSGERSRAAGGHSVTLILGPVTAPMPTAENVRRIDVFSSRDMHDAVLREFPDHDLLIMAAAVADFRPKSVSEKKVQRSGTMTIELESTEDILAAAGRIKRPDQRTVGFSLVKRGEIARSRDKMRRKNCDLIVYNPLDTMSSATIESILLYPDGRSEELPTRAKADFAAILIRRAEALFS